MFSSEVHERRYHRSFVVLIFMFILAIMALATAYRVLKANSRAEAKEEHGESQRVDSYVNVLNRLSSS